MRISQIQRGEYTTREDLHVSPPYLVALYLDITRRSKLISLISTGAVLLVTGAYPCAVLSKPEVPGAS